MPLLGATAWVGAVLGATDAVPTPVLVAGLATLVVGALATVLVTGPATGLVTGPATGLATGPARQRARPRRGPLLAATLLVLLGAVMVTVLRAHQVTHNPVAELAGERAVVAVEGTVASDPVRVTTGRTDQVVWRLRVTEVSGRGATTSLVTPVLVLMSADAPRPALGATVALRGRLAPADDHDLAGLLVASGDPEVRRAPDVWWRGSAAVRESLRESVAHMPRAQRELVPALVVGDDSGLPDDVEADFRTTGLTHLLAVSGTNLTLVVGFLLTLARWSRVRGRWLVVVGAAGVVGFVLLARTEPSVLRAAVMGTVALIGLGHDGRQRGLRALGVAVLVLVLVDPGLAVSAGFALSVLATAGILVLAPGMRDAMARWLPRWLAEAVAVPLAAQLACTPVVAAISGQVSLVAVAANVLVAPAVGPATVLGLAGGLVGVVSGPAGRLPGTLAATCVAWVIEVAERGAALPAAAVGWGTGASALVVLTVLVVLVALAAPGLLRRPATGIGCCLALVVAVVVRPADLGWPPDGWVLVACDVGQGDALVLSAGPHSAVVVDAGPDPQAVDACLRRLDVDHLPLVVLTHFHADHVDGLAGVLDGRTVDDVVVTRLLDPPRAVDEVLQTSRAEQLAPRYAGYGTTTSYGPLSLQTLWPLPGPATRGPGDGSGANDASVVLLAETAGMRILLTGDVEPPGQAMLARTLPGLDVDVLKIPHHGSAHQDEDWLVSLEPAVVLVSVGADNDYGHPAASALDPLTAIGAVVARTDTDGDLAVVVRDGEPEVVTRGRSVPRV
ncbi:MAG: ComEC/Rec2 family competence protein [Nocardioides sp.]|nr:ComEC/Rec2 family competence protein [Nocardioides sp.]